MVRARAETPATATLPRTEVHCGRGYACRAIRSDSAKTGRYTAPKENRKSECEDEDRTYVLRMAWAAYHADRLPAATARVLVGPDADAIEPPVASVNDAVLAQYERDRPEMLARTMRGARRSTHWSKVPKTSAVMTTTASAAFSARLQT